MFRFGDIAYVCTTDEPVKILRQFRHFTLARRPVMGQNGIRYQLGLFLNCELETLQAQTQRTLAIMKVRNDLATAEMQDFAPELPMPALQFKKPTDTN